MAAKSVQSAIDGSVAGDELLRRRSSGRAPSDRDGEARSCAVSAASGDCFTRPAKNGLVFWKIGADVVQARLTSQIRSASRTRARSSGVAPSIARVRVQLLEVLDDRERFA